MIILVIASAAELGIMMNEGKEQFEEEEEQLKEEEDQLEEEEDQLEEEEGSTSVKDPADVTEQKPSWVRPAIKVLFIASIVLSALMLLV